MTAPIRAKLKTIIAIKARSRRREDQADRPPLGSKVPEGGIDPLPRLDQSLLCSAVSKYLGHFPKGLIEFHILIDALDCPALGHPATVRAAAGMVALTTANDVFLDAIQGGPKIFASVAIINRSPESLAGVDLDILSSTEYSFAPSPAQRRANDITPCL